LTLLWILCHGYEPALQADGSPLAEPLAASFKMAGQIYATLINT